MSVFETYELLEMLLYNTVPVKNTNPLAKELLAAFSGIGGVLSAPYEELIKIDGVGDMTAKMITALGDVADHCLNDRHKKSIKFTSYNELGEFVIDYFSGKSENSVIVLSIDADLNLLGLDKLYSIDYASGGVKAQPFLDTVLYRGGSQVVIAHNHPFGSVFPTEGDIQTNIMVENALGSVDIHLAEHFIVCGESCMGFMHHRGEIIKRESQGQQLYTAFTKSDPAEDKRLLSGLLSFASSSVAHRAAEGLISSFGTLYAVMQNDEYALSTADGCSRSLALALRVASAIISRKVTDGCKIGNKCLHIDMKPYISALFFGGNAERVMLISIDRKSRLIGYDTICEGTVNSASFTPRRILETALKRSAAYVIMAHNHPSGDFTITREDIDATEITASVLNSAGITLLSHYVVSDMLAALVPIDYDEYKIFNADRES